MTFDEAIAKVVEIIPNDRVSDFDEVLATIKESQTTDGVENWESKYNELAEKYKKRFTESLNTEAEKETETKTEVEVEIEPTVDNLDFSAESE